MAERDDMTPDDHLDGRLDALLAEARALRPEPAQALVARILLDADRLAPAAAAPPAPARAPRRGWMAALGGWPALGGLAAAAVAGVWIGAVPPAAVLDLAASLRGEAVSVGLGADEDPLALLEG